MESGVHSSLHQNCHHQIIYAKINLKVCYLSSYEREIRHYQHANIDQVQRAIEQFFWEKSFRNLNLHEMFSLFRRTIENILSNYIPDEIIICDGKDHLSLITTSSSQEKNNTCKSYILSSRNPQIFDRVKYLRNQLQSLIEDKKEYDGSNH